MPGSYSKRLSITLFSDEACMSSHRVRLMIAKKGINVDIIDVDPNDPPEDLQQVNPYSSLPTLIDRDLALHDDHIIMQYLDERYPHPPMVAPDITDRAHTRMMIHRIKHDWLSLLEHEYPKASKKRAAEIREEVRDGLLTIAPMLKVRPHIVTDEFSFIDCYLLPLLWRLPLYRIELPKTANGKLIMAYAKNGFADPCFKNSLSDFESEIEDE